MVGYDNWGFRDLPEQLPTQLEGATMPEKVKEKDRVFTYGTLRPTLYPGAIRNFGLAPIGKATLRGPFQMLNLGRFPGLIKHYSLPTVNIVGEVVEVENILNCDRYEGCVPGREGNLYDRMKVTVRLDGAKSEMMEVWVYIYNCDPREHNPADEAGARGSVVKSGDWEEVMRSWGK